MANFCKKCGCQLPENAVFCGECGASVEQKPEPAPSAAPAPAAPKQAAPAPKTDPTVSLWVYVGLFFLFNLPLVGWIICIIMAFAPKNANIRHFAGGLVVYTLIIAILTVGIFIALYAVLAPAIAELREAISEGIATAGENFGGSYDETFGGIFAALGPEQQAQMEQLLAGLS